MSRMPQEDCSPTLTTPYPAEGTVEGRVVCPFDDEPKHLLAVQQCASSIGLENAPVSIAVPPPQEIWPVENASVVGVPRNTRLKTRPSVSMLR